MLVGSTLLSSLVYTLMQTYERREYRLVNVQWNDFSEQFVRNLKRGLKYLLIAVVFFIIFIIAIASLFVLLGFPSPELIVFGVLIGMAACVCLIPLTLLLPVYIMEAETGFTKAVSKAWKFGFSDFWSLLGFLIVIGIISNILQTVTMMPWYITTVVGAVFSLNSDAALTQSIFYKFAVYILGLIQSMGSYVASIIMIIGLAFQYFHSREKHEGVTIESNIINFNELK
jgi:hypothetical protein